MAGVYQYDFAFVKLAMEGSFGFSTLYWHTIETYRVSSNNARADDKTGWDKSQHSLHILRYGLWYFCLGAVLTWSQTQHRKRVHNALQWHHNDSDGVSNHQPHGSLLNRLIRRRSKKTSKLRVTGLCAGNSPEPVYSPHKGPVTR